MDDEVDPNGHVGMIIFAVVFMVTALLIYSINMIIIDNNLPLCQSVDYRYHARLGTVDPAIIIAYHNHQPVPYICHDVTGPGTAEQFAHERSWNLTFTKRE